MTPLLPNFHAWCMAAALFGLLFLLAVVVGQSLRARRRELEQLEAQSAAERDRDHFLLCVGFNDARVFGLIDELGTPVEEHVRARDDLT